MFVKNVNIIGFNRVFLHVAYYMPFNVKMDGN